MGQLAAWERVLTGTRAACGFEWMSSRVLCHAVPQPTQEKSASACSNPEFQGADVLALPIRSGDDRMIECDPI